jgi:choline dehydrogenase
VITSQFVEKVEMEGKKAVGVQLADGSLVRAESEVILSAGAIGSPQLLMLSGIGPSKHLKDMGIEPIIDNPMVGENLQDHLEVYLQYFCQLPVSLYPIGNWSARYLHRRVSVGLEWFAKGSGIAASNQFEMGGFIRTRAGVQHPDIQYHFIPGAVVGQMDFLPHHAFQVHAGTLRPTSRGTLRLASKDPKAHPLIDPNFLATDRDMEDMRIASRLADEIVHQAPFNIYRGERFRPALGKSQSEDILSNDSKLDEWIRNSSHSAYHPSCTCAMGQVVDANGNVLGADNLRVVDASIMPSMTSGNLNAPTIMLAEKISDNIVGRKPLEKQSPPFYVHPQWQSQQR